MAGRTGGKKLTYGARRPESHPHKGPFNGGDAHEGMVELWNNPR